MKKILLTNLVLCSLAFTTNLFANEKGNAGNGLLINGIPIVLDLVEAGV